MNFEYGCFISFRHLPKIEPFVKQLAKDIKEELELFGEPKLKVFLDEDRIKPGDHFNTLIPAALCKSVIMVVVYVPAYFNADKPYCTREFVAFIEHERRRLDELKQKNPAADYSKMYQVITLVMRKDKNRPLPDALAKDRNLVDWSDDENTALYNPRQFSRKSLYRPILGQIRDKILDIWQLAPQLDVLNNCPQYLQLPDDNHPLFQELINRQAPPFP